MIKIIISNINVTPIRDKTVTSLAGDTPGSIIEKPDMPCIRFVTNRKGGNESHTAVMLKLEAVF